MTEDERRSVEEVQEKSNQVGMIIEILRGKGNEEFDTLQKILRESGNEVWAENLDEAARHFKTKGMSLQQLQYCLWCLECVHKRFEEKLRSHYT